MSLIFLFLRFMSRSSILPLRYSFFSWNFYYLLVLQCSDYFHSLESDAVTTAIYLVSSELVLPNIKPWLMLLHEFLNHHAVKEIVLISICTHAYVCQYAGTLHYEYLYMCILGLLCLHKHTCMDSMLVCSDSAMRFPAQHIVTCYLLARRIICGLRIVYLDLLDITSGGVYNHL
jgi:hypothetical protein